MMLKRIVRHCINRVKFPLKYGIALRTLRRCKAEMEARRKRDKKGKIIKVAFVMQYVPSWDKVKLLYETMLADPGMEPYLVCLPMEQNHEDISLSKFDSNDTYDYFVAQGYSCINALREDGSWLELRELAPDFAFYTRPYNILLPKEYKSATVAEYARICVVLYGMALSSIGFDVINPDFFNYVSCYFAEDEEVKEVFDRKFSRGIKGGVQKAIVKGAPSLELVFRMRNEKTDIWSFGPDGLCVLWLPRWSTDRKSGGSNFFKYKEILLAYYEGSENKLLIRPHPLMLHNFLKTGEWTKEEHDDFIEACEQNENTRLDTTKSYVETLWATDILIADITSMLVEFFLTGKPIVYCHPEADITYSKLMEKMLSCCYIVHDKNELLEALRRLEQGIDPLKKQREELAAGMVRKYADGSTARIAEAVKGMW